MIISAKNLTRETRIVFDVRGRAAIFPGGKTLSPDLSDATIAKMRRLEKVWEIGDAPRAASGPAASLTLSQVSEEKAKTVFRPEKERGAALSKAPPEDEGRARGGLAAAAAQIAPGAASADGGGIIPRPNFSGPGGAPGGGTAKKRDRV